MDDDEDDGGAGGAGNYEDEEDDYDFYYELSYIHQDDSEEDKEEEEEEKIQKKDDDDADDPVNRASISGWILEAGPGAARLRRRRRSHPDRWRIESKSAEDHSLFPPRVSGAGQRIRQVANRAAGPR